MHSQSEKTAAKQRIRLSNPRHLLAVGFGSGLTPWLPGTAGTLAALPFWYLLSLLPVPVYWLIVVLAALIGIWLCGKTAHDMGIHDHGAIVWDEFVGLWITLAVLPHPVLSAHGWPIPDWCWLLAGFILFRLLDMWKPWPIRWFDQKTPGGVGIMLDDIIAGIIAAALLYATQYFI